MQILILVPQSWFAEKACIQFTTPRAEKEKGVLGQHERKQRTGISSDTQQKALDFYENDQTSQILLGMKYRVSLHKNVYHKKKLLLGSGWELYNIFREQNPTLKISFSKFWFLKPKCVFLRDLLGRI